MRQADWAVVGGTITKGFKETGRHGNKRHEKTKGMDRTKKERG